MELKNNKKEAAALVLILIVLTSLAILIASTMKILIGSDSRFSHNRNAGKGRSGQVTSGNYICYKKWDGNKYNLYQKRVIYAPDGSISESQLEETPLTGPCQFAIPQGVNAYQIYIVGGGGSGADSKYEIIYNERPYGVLNLDEQQGGEENDKRILDNIEIKAICKRYYTIENSNNRVYCLEGSTNPKTLSEFLNDKSGYEQEIGIIEEDTAKLRHTYESGDGRHECKFESQVEPGETILSNVPPLQEYDLEITPPIRLFNSNDTIIQNISYSYIYNLLKSAFSDNNIAKYSIKEPHYKISSGQPGNPGQVYPLSLKGTIYGKNGANTITIKKEDIGDGGRNGNGGKTVFSYWQRNSSDNTYTQVKKEATGGEKGGTVEITKAKVEPIRDNNEKCYPDYLPDVLPSVFKFNDLFPGYIDVKGNAVDANYFGASGAPGKINNTQDLTGCKQIEFKYRGENGMWNTTPPFYLSENSNNANQCTTGETTSKGSNGAPGAILISW